MTLSKRYRAIYVLNYQISAETAPQMTVRQSTLRNLVWRMLTRLDRANVPILNLLPVSLKRTFVRRLITSLPANDESDLFKVRNAEVRIPGAGLGRLSMISSQDHIGAYLAQVLKSGMTFVDVGADVGVLTVLAAQLVGKTGHVHSIEPSFDNLSILKENLDRNALSNVTIHAVAAGADTATTKFYIHGEHSPHNSLFHVDGMSGVTSSYDVRVVPLDSLITGRIDVVKIDVEGAEVETLLGMERILSENQHLTMIVEWIPGLQERIGHGATKLPDMLLALGFTLRVLSPLSHSLNTHEDILAILPQIAAQPSPLVDLVATR